MLRVTDMDRLEYFLGAGAGFIYNEFEAGHGPADENRLHWAGCSTLRRANLAYPKWFAPTIEQAETWLALRRGPEGVAWRRCGHCRARAK